MAATNFKVYQPFESTDVIVGQTNRVSSGFFPGGIVSFSQSLFTTSSAQTAMLETAGGTYDVLNGLYYTEVYDNSTVNPQVLFTIAYGNINGSGSSYMDSVNQTKAIYSQYKNSLLGTADIDGMFSFRTGSVSGSNYVNGEDIFVINFSSVLTKNQLDAGQWCINFKSGSVDGKYISIIDETPFLTAAQRKENNLVYEIILGTYDSVTGTTVANTTQYTGLGLFYPKNGIIVLNAKALTELLGDDVLKIPSTDLYNEWINQYQIQIYQALVDISPYTSMRMRMSEYVPSSHYFVRVKNQDFNFTNNPTFVYNSTTSTHTRGDIIDSLYQTPTTYVTTVGLYNNLNELVAVAKLSRPTKKDFNHEILLRLRLDF